MTPSETVVLARYVRALCPQQKIDEYTADAWHDVLAALPLDDARQAAARIAKRQPFVAPSEIAAEVRTIRGERLDGFVYVPQPDDENPAAYLANVRQQRAAVADGRRPADPGTPALTARPVAELLAGVGQPIPRAPATAPEQRRGPLGVPCPKCSARVGRPCRAPASGDRPGRERPPHPARVTVARGEQLTDPAAAAAEAERRKAAAARHLARQEATA